MNRIHAQRIFFAARISPAGKVNFSSTAGIDGACAKHWPRPCMCADKHTEAPMSPEAQSTLREVVAIARDGKEFYGYAEMVSTDGQLRERFNRLARAKSE